MPQQILFGVGPRQLQGSVSDEDAPWANYARNETLERTGAHLEHRVLHYKAMELLEKHEPHTFRRRWRTARRDLASCR